MNLRIGSTVVMENDCVKIVCTIQGFNNTNIFFGPFIVYIKKQEMIRSSSLGIFTRNDPEWEYRVV